MERSRAAIIGAAMVTVGLAASTIFAFWPDLEGVVPAIAQARVLYIAAALLLIVAGLLLIAWGTLRSALIDWLAQWGSGRYFVKHARAHELELIFKLARRYFGDESSPVEAIRRYHAHDKKFIHIVKSTRRLLEKDVEEARGYFIVFRLTDAGESAIQEGSFLGASPPSDHLAKPGSAAKAAYIGALVALVRARPYVVAALELHLKQDARYSTVKTLYAKAATSQGHKALKSWQFTPMPGHPDKVGSMFMREHEFDS